MTIHLLQGNLHRRSMAIWSASRNHADSDRAFHSLVYNAFGKERAPRAFVAIANPKGPRDHAQFLAYTASPAEEMRQLALENQSPDTAHILDPESFRSRPVPDNWQPGTTLRFQVRVSPTYRPHLTGVDRDLIFKEGAGPTREHTYYDWLSRLMADRAGAQAPVSSMNMKHYRSRRVRRTPTTPVMTLPDATITGACTIEDPEFWVRALTIGIGRHRAYGYGMLLLSPLNPTR